MNVKVGQTVYCGDPLGTVGNTGGFDGMAEHLHFEIRTDESYDQNKNEQGNPYSEYGYFPNSNEQAQQGFVDLSDMGNGYGAGINELP